MARVTVEDCVLRVPNRFDLVMLASQRARDVSAGAALTIDRDNDRNPVIALREIAEATVPVDDLLENLIKGLQRHVEVEDPEEDEMDLLAIQRDLERDLSEAAEVSASEIESAESAETKDTGEDVTDEVSATEAVAREFREGMQEDG